MTPLVLVDGHNLMHRAEFGFPSRIRSRRGRDITMVFGFYALIRAATRALGLERPAVILLFDTLRSALTRQALEPGYKHGHVPEDDFADAPLVRRAADLLGLRWYECEGHEADDLVATVAATTRASPVYIVSTDRDFYQLVDGRVFVLPRTLRGSPVLIDPEEVRRRFGVEPEQWCDYRALTGDASDGIPGVPGIGPKRASRLLAGGRRLEDVFEDGDSLGRFGPWLMDNREVVLRWRDVMRMARDCSAAAGVKAEPGALPAAKEVVDLVGLWDA